MYSKIIDLIWSDSLKSRIKETKYTFSEYQLLMIIISYAEAFEQRMEMLRAFAEKASADMAKCAVQYAQCQENKLKRLMSAEKGTVYELCIEMDPDAYKEKYLCDTYKNAVKYIDMFCERYGVQESDLTRYTITKRKIYFGSGEFAEDEISSCVMGKGKSILNVYDMEPSFSEMNDEETQELVFPNFLQKGDAVKYRDFYGREQFGICLDAEGALLLDACIVPIDSLQMQYEDFAHAYEAHVHIDLPLLEKAEDDDVKRIQNSYIAAMLEK